MHERRTASSSAVHAGALSLTLLVGAWSWGWLQQRELRWLGDGLGKEAGLLVSVVNAAAGDIEILGLYLDADELAAEFGARHARCAASEKWIKNGFAIKRDAVDHPFSLTNWLRARMVPFSSARSVVLKPLGSLPKPRADRGLPVVVERLRADKAPWSCVCAARVKIAP